MTEREWTVKEFFDRLSEELVKIREEKDAELADAGDDSDRG